MVREDNTTTNSKDRLERLLADPEVKRWYANLRRGSPATADGYARNLARFLAAHQTTAPALLALDPKTRGNLVADHVGALEDLGRAGTYIKNVKQSVQSWLAWNGLTIGRPIKIHGTNRRPTLKRAHIPAQDELKATLNAAKPKARCAVALIAFAGVRPEVLGNHLGDDGLRIADFTDAHLENGALVFDQIPCRIQVREELSKTKVPYFTFLGPEGCQYVQAHLQERAAGGEKLTLDTAIITPRNLGKPFMQSKNVSGTIREPMRAVGLQEPPYIWRSYFNNRCLNAERDGLVRDYKVFIMGHKGDLEVDYGLRKQLPKDTIEQMRRGYQAALKYLETQAPIQLEDPALGLVALLLKAWGHSDEEVGALNLATKSQDDLVELLQGHAPTPKPVAAVPPNQRLVTLGELDQFLVKGWRFLANLGDGRAIIEATPVV